MYRHAVLFVCGLACRYSVSRRLIYDSQDRSKDGPAAIAVARKDVQGYRNAALRGSVDKVCRPIYRIDDPYVVVPFKSHRPVARDALFSQKPAYTNVNNNKTYRQGYIMCMYACVYIYIDGLLVGGVYGHN